MAAIKHTLQRQAFSPSEERLVAVVHVIKAGKRKKDSFLCVAVTTEKPIQALVYQVKKSDRSENVFKKKRSWALRELKLLDVRDPAEIDLQFDKMFKWVASSAAERNSFIQCLWKLSQRYLVQKPEFLNVPPGVLEDLSQTTETDKSVKEAEEIAMAVDTDWHALTPKEEADLESLMGECEFAISNAEAFAEQLARDLSVLDGANIHSIMGSEEAVMELMVLLDHGLQEAMKIEERLDDYDTKLQNVKDLMEIMKDKDTLLQVRNNNHQKLLETLDKLISSLDLDHRHQKALIDGDLTNPKGILQCTEAAAALQQCMAAETHPSLVRMSAVQEQTKRFSRLKTNFSKQLSRHLNNLFIHLGNELGETLNRYSVEMKLPQHHSSHRDLLPYAELMFWLKQADNDSFTKLTKNYTSCLSRLYDREVKEYMETAKHKLAPPRMERKGTLPTPGKHNQGGSSSSINKPYDSRSIKSAASVSTLDSDSQHGSDPDLIGRTKFDQMLEMVLSELGPWCLAEQDFCVRFFHLTSNKADQDTNEAATAEEAEEEDNPWVHRKPANPRERKINEEVRKMMVDLFPSLEAELHGFIDAGDRLDNFNSLYMLVRMSQHVINAEDTGSFLSKTYANCLVQIKRNFDKFIKFQIQNIEDQKISKKGRVGIIPFVHNFEEFAHQAESIFKGSDRRTDLDKAYNRLVTTIFEQIARVADESFKSPREVVLFENYHHMFAALSQLKIACLENQRKEAKHKYQEHLQVYVAYYLGRPMEKLNTFFEGIESKVAAGVKAEEVGYQLAYSKQELRKVIKEYPGKEVKKNLEHLYKKVEKHLCEEENLLQVVWHSMQDEFLKQYNHFEQLIAKCYPGAGITLDFTINDLLGYFSDIAQSH